jgi:hypothetical protein
MRINSVGAGPLPDAKCCFDKSAKQVNRPAVTCQQRANGDRSPFVGMDPEGAKSADPVPRAAHPKLATALSARQKIAEKSALGEAEQKNAHMKHVCLLDSCCASCVPLAVPLAETLARLFEKREAHEGHS